MQPCTSLTAQQIEAVMETHYYCPDHREVWADILPGLEELSAMYADQD